jgi:hypothetical protein
MVIQRLFPVTKIFVLNELEGCLLGNVISGSSKSGTCREMSYLAGTKTRQYFKPRDHKTIFNTGFLYSPSHSSKKIPNRQTRLKNYLLQKIIHNWKLVLFLRLKKVIYLRS